MRNTGKQISVHFAGSYFCAFYQNKMSPGQSALFYGSASVKGAGKVQEELAERLHLENRSSISSYETNRRGLSGELAVAMVQELQTTTDYLLNGTEAEDDFVEKAMNLIRKVKTEAGKRAVLLQLQAVLELENHVNKSESE